MVAPMSFLTARYHLLHPLGSGGMGEVFRAYDRLADCEVALKRLHFVTEGGPVVTSKLASDSINDIGFALAREFSILAGLRHRHIIDVRDFGFAEGQPFYTMSLLEGAHTLIEEVISGLTLPQVVRLLGEVLLALAYLHQHGVVHRDIKPQNVLVSREGIVRLMDFGLAIEASNARELRGTLLYSAPELLDGTGQAAPTGDLYAVGVMAFEALTGAHPFDFRGKSVDELIDSVLAGNARFELLDATLPDWQIGADQQSALKTFVQTLMHVNPAARYQSAGAALHALYAASNLPEPRESTELRESFLQAARFVGREAELGQLKAALVAAHENRGSGWLVGGESGVGKSRLMNEMRTRALVNGYLVLTGLAIEGGGLPYQLWRGVLPPLLLELELSDLEAGVLKPAVPDLERLVGRNVPDAPNLPGAAGRQRFALILVALLRRLARPVLLILEDLHWHDDVEMLTDLLRAAPDLPLLIVGTYRDDEGPDLPGALPGMQVIHLTRLTEAETARLSQSMLGEAVQRPNVIGALWRETEGNAFFLVEVLRVLAEESGGLAQVGQWILPSSIFAGGVQRLVSRRLARVPEWGQGLLRLAALMGRQIDTVALEHAVALDAPLLSGWTLKAWLEAATGAAVLLLNAERWEFTHDKLREHLARSIDAVERLNLHRLAARALEGAHVNDPAYDEVLLTHWRQAGDTERELHYLLLVVQNMVEIRAAYEQADDLIAHGLTLLPEDDRRRAALLNWRSVSNWGKADYERAHEQALLAQDLAERLGAQEEVARSRTNLGLAARERADYATAEAHFQRSLELHRHLNDIPGIARSLNNLGVVADLRGKYTVAEAYYEQSLMLSRDLADMPGIAHALNNLGVIARQRGEYAVAETHYQQSLTLYRTMGHMQGIARSLNNLANVAADRGERGTAEDYYRQSLAVSREIGDTYGITMVLNNLGEIASETQQYGAAEAYFQQGLELARSIGDTHSMALILNNIGSIAFQREEYAAAEGYCQQGLVLYRGIGDTGEIVISLSKLSELALQLGQPSVLAYLREGLTTSLDIGTVSITLELLVTAARYMLRHGEAAEAARVVGLVDANPAIPQALREQGLTKLRDELGAALPPHRLTVFSAQGAALNLETTVHAWLARLEAGAG